MTSKVRSNAPTLPSGTVTFLFTDIEGSTRLWETQREAMTAALARHDALLRQCIEERGGHIFKTAGDAFCAAFATAIGLRRSCAATDMNSSVSALPGSCCTSPYPCRPSGARPRQL